MILPGKYQHVFDGKSKVITDVVVSYDNVSVKITVNGTPKAVELDVSQSEIDVKISGLHGNGVARPQFHRKGLGSLAMNTAIQIIQANRGRHVPVMGISGLGSDDWFSEPSRSLQIEGRNKFWSLFGLRIDGLYGNGYGKIVGTVGELRMAMNGLVMNEHPRYVDFEQVQNLSGIAPEQEVIDFLEQRLERVKAHHTGWRGEEYVAFAQGELDAARQGGMTALRLFREQYNASELSQTEALESSQQDESCSP